MKQSFTAHFKGYDNLDIYESESIEQWQLLV